jgi:hypothetical protein
MKFRVGSELIPSHLDFPPAKHGWHLLTRPSGVAAILLVVVIGLALFLGISLPFYYLASVRLQKPSSLFLVALLIPLVPIHELLHAIVHPGFGMTSRTSVGFFLPRLAFYSHYSGERTRVRFLAGALTPLVVLSIVPLILCTAFRLQLPTIALLSSLNALVSGTDVITALVLLLRCPRGAVVLTDQNQAWWHLQTTAS